MSTGQANPNIYEAVTLFQSEQAVTEISLMQSVAGGLPKRRRSTETMRKDFLLLKKDDYALSELLKAHSHWMEL